MADLKSKLLTDSQTLKEQETVKVLGIKSLVESFKTLSDIQARKLVLPDAVSNITSTISSNFIAIGTERGETFLLQPDNLVPTLLGSNSSCVKCLLFTPDEKYLVVAHETGLVVVWNFYLAKTVLEVKRGKDEFAKMCLSNDSRYILIGYKTGYISIWSIAENQLRQQLRNSIREITAICITSDDKRLVAASDDFLIHTYSMQSFTLESVFKGHTDSITSFALSTDNLTLYSSSHDSTIKVWCLSTKRQKGVLKGHASYALNVVMTSDMKYAISGSSDGKIRVWNTHDYKCEKVYTGCDDWVRHIAVIKDTSYFVSGCDDKSVIIWDIFSQDPVIKSRDHSSFIRALHVTSDSRYLISGSADRSITLFDIKKVAPITALSPGKSEVDRLAMTSDYKYLASASNDGEVAVWNFLDKSLIGRVKVNETFIKSLKFSKDQEYLVAGCEFGMIYIWSFPQLETLACFEGHSNGVMCIAMTRLNNYLITGSKDNNIILWSLKNKVKFTDFKGHTSWVIDLKVSENEEYLYSCSIDSIVIVWNLVNRTQVSVLQGHTGMVNTLFIMKNSSYIISASDDHSVILWDLKAKGIRSKLTGHTDKVLCVAASSDCKFAISGCLSGVVMLWNLTESRQEIKLGNFETKVVSVGFTQDDKYCIAASEYCLKIWNSNSRIVECELQYEKSSLFGFIVTGDNRYIVISSLNRVLVYDTLEYFMNLSYNTPPSDVSFLKTSYPFAIRSYLKQITQSGYSISHSPYMNPIVISPVNCNLLHIYAYLNLYEQLELALKTGCDIIQDINSMSPLTISIIRSTRRCTDVLLQHLINLDETQDSRLFSYIQVINADIPDLIEHGSSKLLGFMQLLFKRSPQADLPMFAVPINSLPIIRHHEFSFISKDKYLKPISDSGDQEIIEFSTSYFNWNFTSGSYDSLRFLNAVYNCSDSSIHATPLMKTLINYKWESMYFYLLFLTVLYWSLLGVMVYLLYEPYQNEYVSYSFVGLNCFFLVYETIQGLATGWKYFTDLWNAIDIFRGASCLYWIYLKMYSPAEITVELTWGMAILCWIRGLTYFRTFRYTRYFIRMILDVMRDTVSFFFILLYTTFAFSSLYYITQSDKNEHNITDTLKMSYELNLGEFNNEQANWLEWVCFFLASIVNCIIMLNLLISILSDAFDRLQTKAEETDIFEMMDNIIEVENMMFWRRNQGSKLFIQKCGAATEIEQRDEWFGKIVAIQRKIDSLDSKLTYTINRDLVSRFEQLETLISQRVQQEISTQLKEMEERIVSSMNSILSK